MQTIETAKYPWKQRWFRCS